MPDYVPGDGGTPRRGSRDSVIIGAWIGGLLAVVAAVVGALVSGVFAGHTVGAGAKPTATVTAPTGPGTGGSATPSATANPSSVYWSGPVGLATSSVGLDFDSRPPSTDQTTIGYFGNTLQVSAHALLSVWNQGGTPSASQCQTWVTTHPTSDIAFPAIGMQICIKTDQGRYGLLQIDSYSGDNNNQLNAIATIWGS
jgi:hypothetical protein